MKLSVPANRPSPGAEMEVLVEDVAFGGQGVARVRGQVVFVPGVLTGERAVVRLVRQTTRYAMAECRRIVAPSPDRTAAPCRYYGRCGGCQYQHVGYARQLEFKRKQVVDILRRIGGLADPRVDPLVPSPLTYAYRNKITLHGPGRPGFHGAPGAPLVPVEACALALKAINDQIPALAHLNLMALEDLVIRADTQGRVGGYRQCGGMIRSLSGGAMAPEPLREIVQGRSLRCPVRSFFQVNGGVLETLIAHVRKRIQAGLYAELVDAYCGVGVFALLAGGEIERVEGIESDAAAVAAARENARRLKLPRAVFHRGAAEALIAGVLSKVKSDRACVLLDPPRAGCPGPVLQALITYKPQGLIYISCAPPILARDLKLLAGAGYRISGIQPFDMFPQTAHCEVVAELHRDAK